VPDGQNGNNPVRSEKYDFLKEIGSGEMLYVKLNHQQELYP
jgi:hypothetical protein